MFRPCLAELFCLLFLASCATSIREDGASDFCRAPSSQEIRGCEKSALLDLPGSPLASWEATPEDPSTKPTSQVAAMGWTYPQWLEHRNRDMTFVFDLTDLGQLTETSPGQRIRLLDDFSKNKQKLIKTLIALQASPKFNRREARAFYDATLADLEAEVARLQREGRDPQLSPDFLKATVMSDVPAAKSGGVEIGAFLITLRDGRVMTAIFTSSRIELKGDHVQKALLQPLIRAKNIAWKEVAAVQFFHTHPGPIASPLTKLDTNLARNIRQLFLSEGGVAVETHVYAIAHNKESTLIFHHGIK